MMYLISVFGVVLAVIGLSERDDLGGGFWWYQAAMVLLIVTGVVMARLTVVVDDRSVTTSFGWGWPRRHIELGDVNGARHAMGSRWLESRKAGLSAPRLRGGPTPRRADRLEHRDCGVAPSARRSRG